MLARTEPARQPEGFLPRRLGKLFEWWSRGFDAANRTIGPWLDLFIRAYIAQHFFISGLLKAANWENALALARYEYPVSWMDPITAAWIGVLIELIAPVLLLFGLAARAAAAAMLALALVIQFNYQALDIHLIWAAMLGWFVVRGAGSVSLDRMLAAGLADSAVPFASSLSKAVTWITRCLEPVYRLLLRSWIAVSLLAAGVSWVIPDPESILIDRSLTALPHWVSLIAVVGFGAGLAVRPTALLLVAVVFSMEVIGGGPIGNARALILLLMQFALSGAGRYALDPLLSRALKLRAEPTDGSLFDSEGIPRVVIVGAGFGGFACARALRSARISVTLIDRHNYHLFQPLLYQVATGALAPGDIAMPIRGLLRDQANARVLLGEVTGVDTEERSVLLGARRVQFDYLVLATGATHSYFGRDEWAPFAPGLKRIEDATSVRSRILLAFERAELESDPAERTALLTFLIVGAGPTGVELAGAIAELARFGMEKEFREVDPARARVILVQSAERILPTFPETLSNRAEASLRALGVEVLTRSRVEHIDTGGVRVSGTPIIARTVFWAAGVTASPAATWLGVAADRSGRVPVEPDLSVPGLSNVFVIGDTALTHAWNGRAVPGIAPAAKQGGQYVARCIRARLEGQRIAPFRYRHLGSLATIGRKAAVADFGFVRLSGTAAWWLWGLVHVYFLAGIRNRISVLLDWAWAYFTFRSSTRLIAESVLSSPVIEPDEMDTAEIEYEHLR
ncbi:MAG: NAD(P)/FAD-dependent oxidoreductase [Gammaproteobacteria bacterium]